MNLTETVIEHYQGPAHKKLALICLAHRVDQGMLWPSNAVLAEMCGVKRRAMVNTVNQLVEDGLIVFDQGEQYRYHRPGLRQGLLGPVSVPFEGSDPRIELDVITSMPSYRERVAAFAQKSWSESRQKRYETYRKRRRERDERWEAYCAEQRDAADDTGHQNDYVCS